MNVMKSYLPNKTFNNFSATCNEICYAPITQTEIQRRLCDVYLSPKKDYLYNTIWETPSICSHHLKCVQYMIKKGYNIRDCNTIVLRHSASHGRLNIVKYLIEEIGLTLQDIRKFDNYTLKSSAKNGHIKVVKYLIEKGLTLDDIRAEHDYALRSTENEEVLNYLLTFY